MNREIVLMIDTFSDRIPSLSFLARLTPVNRTKPTYITSIALVIRSKTALPPAYVRQLYEVCTRLQALSLIECAPFERNARAAASKEPEIDDALGEGTRRE